MSNIYPILLAGGYGTRLWPLSRRSYPKQFSNLIGRKTLFQETALRVTSTKSIKFEPHITLTNADFRFIVSEQIQALGVNPGHILIEPKAKNTAPAILAASLFAYKQDPKSKLLVTPSDHNISDVSAFHTAVKIGLDHIDQGKFVTFGVPPTHPETGYGYLELDSDPVDNIGTKNVSKFVEKPNFNLASTMIESKNFLWNAGIFLFRSSDMIKAFEDFAPDILVQVRQAISSAVMDLNFLRLNHEPWKNMQNISIDYAIMEKSENLVAVQLSSKWSDLGDWDAVWKETNKDVAGVALSGPAHAIDCTNTLLRSENEGQQIVGLGIDNIAAIAMPDAVLVVRKDDTQSVKKVVSFLKNRKIPQSENFPKDHRPWGWFESLTVGERFQVKRIFVKPGGALSLQSHQFRSEHWVVVEGVAKVTIDNMVKLVKEGESVYVPLGSIHRLENPNETPMILIEIQTGDYLGEDDIKRYEDIYERP